MMIQPSQTHTTGKVYWEAIFYLTTTQNGRQMWTRTTLGTESETESWLPYRHID